MAITGTLCKLDHCNVIREVLITEYKGIPHILCLSAPGVDFSERAAWAASEAVKLMTDASEIYSVMIIGVGNLSLAEW